MSDYLYRVTRWNPTNEEWEPVDGSRTGRKERAYGSLGTARSIRTTWEKYQNREGVPFRIEAVEADWFPVE